jgi:hypothetical protein
MGFFAQLWSAHSTAITVGAIYCFLGGVSCLPEPGDPRPFSIKFYESTYLFLHLLSNRIVTKNPTLAPTMALTKKEPQ